MKNQLDVTCYFISNHWNWNKITSDIKLVFHSSTIARMHGPINIKCLLPLLFPSIGTLVCPSFRLSAYISSTTTGRIYVKFWYWGLLWINLLRNSEFCYSQAKMSGTLGEWKESFNVVCEIKKRQQRAPLGWYGVRLWRYLSRYKHYMNSCLIPTLAILWVRCFTSRISPTVQTKINDNFFFPYFVLRSIPLYRQLT